VTSINSLLERGVLGFVFEHFLTYAMSVVRALVVLGVPAF
jgi:hypothetical protein